MPLNSPNEGERRILQYTVNAASPSDLYLVLFGNDVTPAENDTIATFTEISGGGYANITLSGAGWNVANGNNAVATHTAQTFTFTGATSPNTVFGYLVKTKSDHTVIWAERFPDAPYPINNNDDAITVTPRIELEG